MRVAAAVEEATGRETGRIKTNKEIKYCVIVYFPIFVQVMDA